MLDAFRRFLSLVLAWFLVAIPTVQAQQSTMPSAGPVPPQILSARSVFVSNGGGNNYFDSFTGGPDRAYSTLYADIQRSGRYQLVSSPARADLIFEIRGVAPAVGDVDYVDYNPQLILSVRDPKTSAILWTTRDNVRAVGRQKSRDRQFDDSVAVLLDKFGQATGRPLSPQQLKAIRDNSNGWRMSTDAKVFLVVSLAGAAALAAYGAYRVSHPPAPPPMPQPTLPVFPF